MLSLLRKFVKDKDNHIKVLQSLRVEICGKNNIVEVDGDKKSIRGRITIYGDNNVIKIKKGRHINLRIIVGIDSSRRCDDSQIHIGEGMYWGKGKIEIGENHYRLSIGDDCLFSSDIEIMGCDNHSVLDEHNNRINKAYGVSIGDHVWVGKRAKIMKNAKIPSESIVAFGSVVSKRFEEKGVIIAGNPAKVVKNNVRWVYDYPNNYDAKVESV